MNRIRRAIQSALIFFATAAVVSGIAQ